MAFPLRYGRGLDEGRLLDYRGFRDSRAGCEIESTRFHGLQRGDNQHSSRELPSQAAIAEKLDVSISSIKRARTIKATGATAVLEPALAFGPVFIDTQKHVPPRR